MGEKKSARSKARSKKTVAALTLAVACAATAVMLIAARRHPAVSTDAAPEMQQEAAIQASAASAPAASVAPKDAPATAKKLAPTKAAASVKAPASAMARVEDATPVTASEAPAARQVAESEMKAPVQESLVKGVTPPMAAVTINGCLERAGDGFRLKDTDGATAPKGRSWKSGFLKKGSPKIELVDSANRLKFRDHVGQRVSVTGMLIDREMQARSLQRVATSCE